MFGLGVWELLIILAIVLLLFGPRRLKTLGSDLGTAIKGFRSAVSDDEKQPPVSEKVIENDAGVIDGKVDATRSPAPQEQTERKQDTNV